MTDDGLEPLPPSLARTRGNTETVDDGRCICDREARRDPHSCAHELKAEVERLRAALGTAHDILAADEDRWATALIVLREALDD